MLQGGYKIQVLSPNNEPILHLTSYNDSSSAYVQGDAT